MSEITVHDGRGIALHRISAMVLRYWYLLLSSWPRFLELLYWPVLQIITWGFLQSYISANDSFFARAGGTLIGAVILWDILFRGQLGFSISFLEEIWARNINSYKASLPGTPVDPSAWQSGGILDFDSNAGCVIDGRRQENVVWQAAPPAGTYQVHVDTASLCGMPASRWTVRVILSGAEIADSQGTSLPGDARFSKGPGSGIHALSFDVPPR